MILLIRTGLRLLQIGSSTVALFTSLFGNCFANSFDFGLALEELPVIFPHVQGVEGSVVGISNLRFRGVCTVMAHIPFDFVNLRWWKSSYMAIWCIRMQNKSMQSDHIMHAWTCHANSLKENPIHLCLFNHLLYVSQGFRNGSMFIYVTSYILFNDLKP